MSDARRKLNAASIHGLLLVAGLIAAIAQPWLVFGLVAVGLIITASHAGDIRGKRR